MTQSDSYSQCTRQLSRIYSIRAEYCKFPDCSTARIRPYPPISGALPDDHRSLHTEVAVDRFWESCPPDLWSFVAQTTSSQTRKESGLPDRRLCTSQTQESLIKGVELLAGKARKRRLVAKRHVALLTVSTGPQDLVAFGTACRLLHSQDSPIY